MYAAFLADAMGRKRVRSITNLSSVTYTEELDPVNQYIFRVTERTAYMMSATIEHA